MVEILYFLIVVLALTVSTEGANTQIYINPDQTEVVRFANESFAVSCFNPTQGPLTWYRGGSQVSQTKGRIYLNKSFKANDTSILSLIFTSLAHGDNGNYTCTGEVDGKNEHITIRLIVQSPISFVDTPTLQTVVQNENGVVKCEVKGDPEPTTQWQVKGKTPKAGDPKYDVLADGLLIKNVSMSDAGVYICRALQVTNSMSSVIDRNITVKVAFKPKFDERTPKQVYGYLGGYANLTCLTIAEPPATIRWYRDNKVIHPKSYYNSTVYGENNKYVLRILLNNATIFGKYKCVAGNNLGTVSRWTDLERGVKPDLPNRTEIHSTTHNSVKLHIQGPSWSEMEIISYRVQILEKSQRDQGRGWDHSREAELHKDEPFVISDLKPDTEYIMRVTAQNLAGPGDYAPELKTRTLVSGGSRLVSNNCYILASLILAWILARQNC